MIRTLTLLLGLCISFGNMSSAYAQTIPGPRIEIALDTGEAEQVLAILALRQAGTPIADMQWQKLFAATPYQRLKQREKSIGEQFHDPSVAFSDEDFKKFVLSDDLLSRATPLRDTLERWKRIDLRRSAERVLTYLPDGAVIHVKVYPTVKPERNSFVWDLSSDPAIFLFLDPDVTGDKFENMVAHEMHHIGLGSLGPVYDQKIAGLPERARSAANWMAGFGEGLAVLAAAGGPAADPHAASTSQEHSKWEGELGNFNTDLPAVNGFFLDLLDGKLEKDAAEAKGSSFFGSHQGPWYTIGYKMAVMVETRYGRPALVGTMLDYRCLLALYNRVAIEQNASHREPLLPLWSDTMLSQVGATTCAVPVSLKGTVASDRSPW